MTFDGYTITGGVSPIFGSTDSSNGTVGGVKCTLKKQAGIGVSFDPFSFDIPCNCAPQRGDTIKVVVVTIAFFDITTIEWNLCGGECRGSKTGLGISFGLEVKLLEWVV